MQRALEPPCLGSLLCSKRRGVFAGSQESMIRGTDWELFFAEMPLVSCRWCCPGNSHTCAHTHAQVHTDIHKHMHTQTCIHAHGNVYTQTLRDSQSWRDPALQQSILGEDFLLQRWQWSLGVNYTFKKFSSWCLCVFFFFWNWIFVDIVKLRSPWVGVIWLISFKKRKK